jgi:hypothetical protein
MMFLYRVWFAIKQFRLRMLSCRGPALLMSSAALVVAAPGARAQMRGGVMMRGMMTPQMAFFSAPLSGRMNPAFPLMSPSLNPGGAFGNMMPFGSAWGFPFYGGAGLGNNLYGANPLGALGYAGMYSSAYANPYAYSSGYAGGGYSGGGYGGGGYSNADPLTDLGRLEVGQQEASLLQEQVRAERVANRRKLFDEYLYEKDNAVTPEDERKKFASLELERSRNNTPVTEIQSGKALNALLSDLSKHVKTADWTRLQGFPLPFEGGILEHINVTQTGANIGLLRNHGSFVWPIAFEFPELQEQREELAALAHKAVSQAASGSQVAKQFLADMRKAVAALRLQLRTRAIAASPPVYIDGIRFLNHFEDAIQALEQRDVAKHFNGVFPLKGVNTIAVLVEHMNTLGLRFAPAIEGDESAYRALHSALAACDRALVEGTELR